MDRIETVADVLNNLARTLDADYLEPDVERPDWSVRRADVARLREMVRDDLFADYAGRLDADEVSGTNVTEARVGAATVLGEVAALLHLSGDALNARAMQALALSFAPRTGHDREELLAAKDDLAGYARLVHGRWLLRHKRWKEADKVLEATLKRPSLDARLKASVQTALNGPRPLEGGAPALFRVNGFGVGLYGRRDQWPDGSYVATTWLSALFVPVFPLRSYRVRDHENGGWVFFARERLSGFARTMRALVLVGAATAGGVVAYNEWSESPSHRVSVSMDAARAAEQQHHDAAALRAYEDLLRTYADRVDFGDVREAALAVVRLAGHEQHGNATADDVDRLLRIVRHYDDLPGAVKRPEVARPVLALIRGWTDQVGDATPVAVRASMRLTEAGARIASASEREEFTRRAHALHERLGAHYGADWPLEALPEYLAAGDEGTVSALPVVRAILASPSLTLAAESDLQAWLARSYRAPVAEVSAALPAALTAAHALDGDTARHQALEAGDRAALETSLRAHPGDQLVIAALASQQHHEGGGAVAMRTLAAIGASGRMIPPVRGLYAQLLVEAGRVAEADELLTRTIEPRLPRYQAAQRALMAAVETTHHGLVERARQGLLPSDVNDRLRDQPQAEQQRIFTEWAGGQIRASSEITGLRTARDAASDVVPLVLSAGSIKLRRANGLDGPARARTLAEAERLFLSIREQAEGSTEFRLGLGQVYHRLGRTAEGERELGAVLSEAGPREKLGVAEVYRELGNRDRARQVAEDVFNHATGEEKAGAALLLSLLGDTEDAREQWLRRVEGQHEIVRIRLREIEARRALAEGRSADADRAFADVAASYTRLGPHDASASNNAALADFGRYNATGDIAHINAAVQLLDRSRAAEPDSAIVADNLADALLYQGYVRALGSFVRVSTLRASSSEVQRLFGALVDGPRRAEVLTALRRDPSLNRALDLLRQTEALAPQNATLYRQELDHLQLLDDDQQILDLLARVTRVGRLETTEIDAQWRRWVEATDDTEALRALDGRARLLDRSVAEAEQAHDAPTLAAALFLRADVALYRASMSRAAEEAHGAAQFARRSAAAWDGFAVDNVLAEALLLGAMIDAAPSSPPLAAALTDDLRAYRANELLLRLRRRSGGPEAIASLRARPEVEEALTASVAAATAHPYVGYLMLGRAFQHEALTAAAAPALAREGLRARQDLDARLNPARDYAERLALFRR